MSGPSSLGAAGRRRVVVTGLGCISPVGNTITQAWSSLVAGRTGIATVTKFDHSGLSVHFAGEVKDFNVEAYLPAKEARHMDTFIHYGIAAGLQAIEDSGLEITEANAERIGAFVGSGIGLCNLKARILNRLKTSRNPIMNKGVHVPRFFGRQIGFDIKVFDFASEVD